MKARVSFDLDLAQIAPEASLEDLQEVVTALLLAPARKTHKEALQAQRRDQTLEGVAKTAAMTRHIHGMMLTLMAEVNCRVDPLPNDAPIETELPFERQSD
jgi:hypothetical protein